MRGRTIERRRSGRRAFFLTAGIALNLVFVAATVLAAMYWLPSLARFADFVDPAPIPSEDWSAERLSELLTRELTEEKCRATEAVIAEVGSNSSISEALAAVGLDIYQAREKLLEIDAPALGYASALTEQVELESGRVLAAVLEAKPEFEDRLDFQAMLNLATLELVDFCALDESLGEAFAAQQQADVALKKLRELADEAAWYPRGFTRSLENLAWGWTSDEGDAPCSNCVYWKVTVITRDGCLGGALVEIKIFDGEAELVTLRETWPRLLAEQSVTGEFPYLQLDPELSAQVTMAECFSHEQP